jgi:CheY-like chemotaxis protein
MKKILIADDSEYVQEKLKLYIPEQYTVVTASCGVEAREQYQKEQPDLTFLDVVMPEGEEEGLMVLRAIKQQNPQAPVAMISAIGANRVKAVCKDLGVTDYIEKPFDRQEVTDLVNKYLG